MSSSRQRIVLIVAAITVGFSGCGDDDGSSSDAETTTTEERDPKFDLTFRDWETATLTSGEQSFQQFTRLAYGIGTNPPKMLEHGYDLCERFKAAPDAPRADAIRDWAVENSAPLQTASLLGDNATDHLCPE